MLLLESKLNWSNHTWNLVSMSHLQGDIYKRGNQNMKSYAIHSICPCLMKNWKQYYSFSKGNKALQIIKQWGEAKRSRFTLLYRPDDSHSVAGNQFFNWEILRSCGSNLSRFLSPPMHLSNSWSRMDPQASIYVLPHVI